MSIRYCENPFSREEFEARFPKLKKVNVCLSNDDAWKEYYLPYNHEFVSKDHPEDKLALKCFGDDKRKWFKMSYRNVMNLGTPEQKELYHDQRKRYLCNLMTRATANTGFCFKMMGSESAASDVDISILPKILYPNPSTAVTIVRNFYKMHQDDFIEGDTPSVVFDANIYATNFTQVFETPVPSELSALVSANKIQMVANPKMKARAFDMPCFKNPNAEFVDAVSIYIPSPDNSLQKGFAVYKLAKTYEFNADTFVESITSILDDGSNNTSQSSYKQMMELNLQNVLGESFEIAKGIHTGFLGVEGADNTNLEKYGQLITDYFNKRTEYLQSGTVDAATVINTLSEATLYEDEAYHTQGAFMDINVRPSFKFVLKKHEFRDSILENMGFISEYGNLEKHKSSTLLQRLEKINKYFERICASLIEIWTVLSRSINSQAFSNAQKNVNSRVSQLSRVQDISNLLNELRKSNSLLTDADIGKLITLLINPEPRFAHLIPYVLKSGVVDEDTFNILCRVVLFLSMTWLATALGITHSYSITIDEDEQYGGRRKKQQSKPKARKVKAAVSKPASTSSKKNSKRKL